VEWVKLLTLQRSVKKRECAKDENSIEIDLQLFRKSILLGLEILIAANILANLITRPT
jgi:uncharacterized membrane protein